MRNAAFIWIIAVILISRADAQSLLRDSVMNATIIGFNYTLQFPVGELNDRFGVNSNIGNELLFKMKKNVLFGLHANFLFGGRVKEDTILQALVNEQGFLIDRNGFLSDYRLQERGFTFGIKGGKIFNIVGPNPNCGIALTAGAGFLQHKIRIDLQNKEVPHLSEEYRKGYDRLTNGLYFEVFSGYFHLDTRKLVNYYAGIHWGMGFTKNRRTWNYDANAADDHLRKDLLVGIRFGWMIPVYRKPTQRFYYN